MTPVLPRIVTAADRDALAGAVARDLARVLVEGARSHSSRKPFEWAISGGFVHEVLAATRSLLIGEGDADADWSHIRVWWVDERFVQSTHPERNDDQAMSALLSHMPGVQVRPMPSDRGQGLDEAAREYADRWAADMGDGCLDFALIGMGPDGHIASLFPHYPHDVQGAPTFAVRDSPKLPPLRLTLPMSSVASAQRIWVVAPGKAKAQALREALVDGAAPADRPIAGIVGDRVTFWLDAESAGQLPLG